MDAQPVGPSSTGTEPAIRVAALHALEYCERLFYLEEVEEIRIADERVYSGRTLHVELTEEESAEQVSIELSDEDLGITGRLDAVRHRDGHWFAYEHKRGRAFRDQTGKPDAWPSDVLQVSAYGLLLERHLGLAVSEGRVRYHKDNLTVRVCLDGERRASVARAVQRARVLRSSLERPPVTIHASRCLHCSLAPVCLPEEERLAHDSSHGSLSVSFRLTKRARSSTSCLTAPRLAGRARRSLSVHPIRMTESFRSRELTRWSYTAMDKLLLRRSTCLLVAKLPCTGLARGGVTSPVSPRVLEGSNGRSANMKLSLALSLGSRLRAL